MRKPEEIDMILSDKGDRFHNHTVCVIYKQNIGKYKTHSKVISILWFSIEKKWEQHLTNAAF